MGKASAPKKRYILVQTPKRMKAQEFSHAFLSQALSFFGEYGSAKTSLKVISYDGTWGIVRCARNQVNLVLGFCALMANPRIIAKASSGTIKSLNDRKNAWEMKEKQNQP